MADGKNNVDDDSDDEEEKRPLYEEGKETLKTRRAFITRAVLLARAKNRRVRASAACNRLGGDGRVSLNGGEAECWVRVQPRQGTGVDGVADGPALDLEDAAGADAREAVSVGGRVVPRQIARVER